MLQEFQKFLTRGNVIDLAVAVVIGGAFNAIVASLVADIIMPLVGILTGGINFSGLSVTFGNAELTYGNFIQAILNFLIVGFAMFLIVRAYMSTQKQEQPKAAAPAEPPADVKLLTEIRDLLKERE